MPKTTVNDLHQVFVKHSMGELAERIAGFKDKEKRDQIAGLEELIQDCKAGVIKNYTPAILKTIKHVYRDLTS